MDTILSNWYSTNILTKPCTAVPVMDLLSGETLVSTISTHQTMLWTDKLLSPTVALLTLLPRGTLLVIVHSLLEAATSLRLILKCFTRQLLKAGILLFQVFGHYGDGPKSGQATSGRGVWERKRERATPLFFCLSLSQIPLMALSLFRPSLMTKRLEQATDYILTLHAVTVVL